MAHGVHSIIGINSVYRAAELYIGIIYREDELIGRRPRSIGFGKGFPSPLLSLPLFGDRNRRYIFGMTNSPTEFTPAESDPGESHTERKKSLYGISRIRFFFRMTVKISNSKILERLTSRI